MTTSVIRQLIFKDWRLHRLPLFVTIAVGAFSLIVLQQGGEVPFVLGSVWFFVALIVFGNILPISAIVNERKKQTMAFVMSLPVSAIQYTTAKLLATMAIFLVPWLTLFISALVLIQTRNILPHGAIPAVLILALMPAIGFCLISGTALLGESEGLGIAATIVCNSSYGLAWYLLSRIPSFSATWKSRVIVWNGMELRIIGIELAFIAVSLAVTFFLQSRKRDFVN